MSKAGLFLQALMFWDLFAFGDLCVSCRRRVVFRLVIIATVIAIAANAIATATSV